MDLFVQYLVYMVVFQEYMHHTDIQKNQIKSTHNMSSERIHYTNPSSGINVPVDWCHKYEC